MVKFIFIDTTQTDSKEVEIEAENKGEAALKLLEQAGIKIKE